ncbi:F-box protein CPR1-like protein [Tanacetum coccineum]
MTDDVVEDILTRLDVKDVLRCKSVCKSWYSLISSPYFVKSHLLKHKSNCSTRINNNDVGNTRIAMPTYWKITNDDDDDDDDDANLYQSNIWNLVGSSNGLVCVSLLLHEVRDDYLILLINPRTREVRELPLPTMPPIKAIYELSLSFGYDSSTDDYKLVMGIKKTGVDGSLVQVFSLKSMTWKLIGHINCLLIYSKSGVLLNGAFHWFASDLSIKKLVILSFDLSREEFKVIPVPVPDDSTRYVVPFSTLGIFQDNLCMSCVDENEFYYGLWVMHNNNVKHSWELLPNDYEIKSPDAVYYMKIYACTSLTKKRMGFFCDDKACFSRSLKHTISAPLYVQSLVSPYLNTEIPSHPGSVKVCFSHNHVFFLSCCFP